MKSLKNLMVLAFHTIENPIQIKKINYLVEDLF